MTFTQTLAAVLNDAPEIPSLPESALVVFGGRGEPLPYEINGQILLRLVRLQTLIAEQNELASLPDHENICASAEREGKSFVSYADSRLSISEDATRLVMALEQLMVRTMREAIPAESEQFGVRYIVNASSQVLRCREPARRFLA